MRRARKDAKDLFEPSSGNSSGEDSGKEKDTSDGNSELDNLRTNPKALKKFFINEVAMFLKESFYQKLMQHYSASQLVEQGWQVA